MRVGGDGPGDLGEVQVHGFSIGEGQHQGGGGGAGGTDGAEDVGPLVAGIAQRAGAGAPPGPDAGQRALLADARLILEPDLDGLAAGHLGQDLSYRRGETFLKASWTASSALG